MLYSPYATRPKGLINPYDFRAMSTAMPLDGRCNDNKALEDTTSTLISNTSIHAVESTPWNEVLIPSLCSTARLII